MLSKLILLAKNSRTVGVKHAGLPRGEEKEEKRRKRREKAKALHQSCRTYPKSYGTAKAAPLRTSMGSENGRPSRLFP